MTNEQKQISYPCVYAESMNGVGNDDFLKDIRCKITGEFQCPLVLREYDISNPQTRGKMEYCPGFNIPKDLAIAIIKARLEMKKDELEDRLSK